MNASRSSSIENGCIETINAALATGEWLRRSQNLLITGATGSGKTWLACALAQQCCRQGASVQYWRVPRLIEELRVAHGDGSYIKFLKSTAKSSLIVLDDWGFPIIRDGDVPGCLTAEAREAVRVCPKLALRLESSAKARSRP